MVGRIFDIKKFAVHDGPGIRSTVFLKGCPLRCIWCQNPEGLETAKHLWYFENRCIKCEKCLHSCKMNALSKNEDGKPFIKIDTETCINDGACVEVCPTNALTFDSREVSVEDVVSVLLEDAVFYKKSGGGITLSGGDPIFQHEFSIEILRACKDESLHTAIETSMYTTPKIFEKFFALVDYFIVDLKIFDSESHKKYIGQDNDIILNNFKALTKTDKEVLVRIPIIPGITDSEDNIKNIAKFVKANSDAIPIELINYNPFADNKYRLMNKDYELDGTTPLTEEDINKLYDLIEQEGVTALRATHT